MRSLVRLSYEQWNHSNFDSLNNIKWSTIMQSYNYYRVIITDLNAPSYRSSAALYTSRPTVFCTSGVEQLLAVHLNHRHRHHHCYLTLLQFGSENIASH